MADIQVFPFVIHVHSKNEVQAITIMASNPDQALRDLVELIGAIDRFRKRGFVLFADSFRPSGGAFDGRSYVRFPAEKALLRH